MISSQSQSSLEAIMFNGCDERHLCKKGHPLFSQLGGQSFRYLKHFLHHSLKPWGGSKTILTNRDSCLRHGSADSLLIWFTVPTDNISLPLQRSCLVRRIQEVLQLVLQGAWNPVAQSRDKNQGGRQVLLEPSLPAQVPQATATQPSSLEHATVRRHDGEEEPQTRGCSLQLAPTREARLRKIPSSCKRTAFETCL